MSGSCRFIHSSLVAAGAQARLVFGVAEQLAGHAAGMASLLLGRYGALGTFPDALSGRRRVAAATTTMPPADAEAHHARQLHQQQQHLQWRHSWPRVRATRTTLSLMPTEPAKSPALPAHTLAGPLKGAFCRPLLELPVKEGTMVVPKSWDSSAASSADSTSHQSLAGRITCMCPKVHSRCPYFMLTPDGALLLACCPVGPPCCSRATLWGRPAARTLHCGPALLLARGSVVHGDLWGHPAARTVPSEGAVAAQCRASSRESRGLLTLWARG